VLVVAEDIIDYYILFPNHMEGLRLQKALTEAGVKSIIAPTPREASNFCGMSLRITMDSLEAAKEIIQTAGVTTEGIIPVRRAVGVWTKSC